MSDADPPARGPATASPDAIGAAPDSPEARVPRREPREPTVREVAFAPFPRIRRDDGWRRGFTRDLSRSGACLRVSEQIEAGSLIRVIVHEPDGGTTRDSVGRVVWCRAVSESECRMGLAWLASRPAARRRSGSRPPGSGPGRAPA